MKIHFLGNISFLVTPPSCQCFSFSHPSLIGSQVKGLCEGKQQCSIRPTSAMFGVGTFLFVCSLDFFFAVFGTFSTFLPSYILFLLNLPSFSYIVCSLTIIYDIIKVTCRPTWRNARRMWITYSCVRGHDRTTFRARDIINGWGK